MFTCIGPTKSCFLCFVMDEIVIASNMLSMICYSITMIKFSLNLELISADICLRIKPIIHR